LCRNEVETDKAPSGQRPRPRSNTARSYSERLAAEDESPIREKAPILPARGGRDSPQRRPTFNRTATGESDRNDGQAQGIYKLVRIPTEPTALVQAHRGNLRPVTNADHDERSISRSDSPMSRASTTPSRAASWSAVDNNGGTGPKKTIPPPINRAKKPPPPPPPMKRSALSTSQIPQSQHY
jgi:hypothetical protein